MKKVTPDKEYEEAAENVKELKADLSAVGEVTDLIYDYRVLQNQCVN